MNYLISRDSDPATLAATGAASVKSQTSITKKKRKKRGR